MQHALRHRGPDDQGVWHTPAHTAAFAHTRLAILDLSPAGRQPMSTADGRLTITYNGEILNFQELRSALAARGARFTTRTDTEVILKGYEYDGSAFVSQLRGMFAFALWDEREHTCLLARDRFGIKPLYYHASAERLVFGSEVRAVMASGLVPSDLDPQAVYQYFRSGSVPEPLTLVRGLGCLGAGQLAVWQRGKLAKEDFWGLEFDPADQPEHIQVEDTRRALLDSVRCHFISDAPVGVFLSGGIDSTALLALARAAGQPDLHTFSISFPDSPNDEGPLARRTAAHFATTHVDCAIDAAAGKELFRRFLTATDQPSIDGLNTFAVSKVAREEGMKVVLSGLGGDEIFGGYPSFARVPALAAWSRRLLVTGPLRSAAGRGLQHFASDPRWRRIGDLLDQPATLTAAYETFRGVFTRAESALLTARYAGGGEAVPGTAAEPIPRDPTETDTVSRLELTRYMRNQLLRDADIMSMAWGLELRVPFLDNEVVRVLARVPAAVRLRQGKRLLLEAVPEVPDWITLQPKRGFQFPFPAWLDKEWSGMFAEIDRTSPVPTQTWYRQWCLMAFEHWVATTRRAAP